MTRKPRRKDNDLIILSAPQKRRDLFWNKVDKSGDCWLFTGALPKNRYAPFSFNYTQMNGHRASLLWATGEPQPGLQANHRCRNKHCVNPKHLYWGTSAENARDAVTDGTSPGAMTYGEKKTSATLSDNTVRHIWVDLMDNPRDLAGVAKKYQTNIKIVWLIKERKNWTAITEGMPALLNVRDTSAFPPFNRKAREPLTREQVQIICKMIDSHIALTKIAEHTACAPSTLRNIFFRERGKFPEPCVKRGFKPTRTKGRAQPLHWSQSTD